MIEEGTTEEMTAGMSAEMTDMMIVTASRPLTAVVPAGTDAGSATTPDPAGTLSSFRVR